MLWYTTSHRSLKRGYPSDECNGIMILVFAIIYLLLAAGLSLPICSNDMDEGLILVLVQACLSYLYCQRNGYCNHTSGFNVEVEFVDILGFK